MRLLRSFVCLSYDNERRRVVLADVVDVVVLVLVVVVIAMVVVAAIRVALTTQATVTIPRTTDAFPYSNALLSAR